MSSLHERMEKLEFHQQLLLKMADTSDYPFYKIVIEKGISRGEMEEVFSLCEEVNQRFEELKEEGFVGFSPLLIHFVGMLNPKLNPKETIAALYEQGYYRALMTELVALIEEVE